MLKSCVIFSEALHNIFKKDYTHDSRGINCFMNRNSLKNQQILSASWLLIHLLSLLLHKRPFKRMYDKYFAWLNSEWAF